MNRKVYSSTGIVHADVERVLAGRDAALGAVCGVDVGKREMMAVLRWGDGRFERPWRVANPGQIGLLVRAAARLAGAVRGFRLAMESTGTYGDALRQALADAGVTVHLVGGKLAHDYAEVFDGTPSQHDGKDAAVVAELCALGKSSAWPFDRGDDREQRIELLVDQMAAAAAQKARWALRMEGLLARHWPEASAVLGGSSGTMLRAMKHYGGPRALAGDDEAQARLRLRRWSRGKLDDPKVGKLVASAAATPGVRQTEADVQRVRWCAGEAMAAGAEVGRCRRALTKLAEGHPTIARQGEAIGLPTACVLWRCLGDPCRYHCAAAYRKAMGLNLKERSSGKYRGQLKITKRGSGMVRRWLYLSALRLIRNEPKAKSWYRRKLGKAAKGKRRVVMGLARKLALSMWAVAKYQQAFDVDRMLGASRPSRERAAKKGVAEAAMW